MIYRIIYYFFAGISDLIKPFDMKNNLIPD